MAFAAERALDFPLFSITRVPLRSGCCVRGRGGVSRKGPNGAKRGGCVRETALQEGEGWELFWHGHVVFAGRLLVTEGARILELPQTSPAG